MYICVFVCRKLSAHDDYSKLAVHVCMDMLVIVDDLSEFTHVIKLGSHMSWELGLTVPELGLTCPGTGSHMSWDWVNMSRDCCPRTIMKFLITNLKMFHIMF